jgi:hypothetical protein
MPTMPTAFLGRLTLTTHHWLALVVAPIPKPD